MKESHYKDMFRIKTYMEKHYWEDIGVEDIAKHIGYTPRHCNVLFNGTLEIFFSSASKLIMFFA